MAVVTIIGAGMMGSALAFPARENGHEVRLVGTHLDREIIETSIKTNRHPKFDTDFPAGLKYYQIEDVEKAIDVTSTRAIDASGKPQGDTVKKDGYSEALLTSCELFTVKRLDVEERAELVADDKSFVSLVALEGNGVVMHGDTCVTLYKGDSLFIPASFGKFEILGEVTVIETRV